MERNPKLSASLRAPGKTFLEHNKVGEKYLLEVADTQYLIDYKTEKNSEVTQENESADSETISSAASGASLSSVKRP